MIERTARGRISRRKFLEVTGVAAAASPFIWTGRSSAAGAWSWT